MKIEELVTVAIPVRNGEPHLEEVLAAVGGQRVQREVELLVLDSGSTDRSLEIALAAGAKVIEIPPSEFSHGRTRNLMMDAASGAHVAFLTQDACPADDRWLAELLDGFELGDDVGLVFGPYVPRPGASPMVSREFRDFFSGFSPNGRPVVQRLVSDAGTPNRYRRSPGPLTFFTDANGCVARWAWERVPYRDAPYAEDQLLAAEMIEAGFAKVFNPNARVLHSHEYGSVDLFRRCFDEWRGLREVYDFREPLDPRRHVRRLLREVKLDRAFMRQQGAGGRAMARGTWASLRHHAIRALGSVLGGRADALPSRLRAVLSLERRATFEPAASAPGGRVRGEEAL